MCKKCCKNCKFSYDISYQYYCENENADLGGWDGVEPNDCCEFFEPDERHEKKEVK